jgi:hypothetical protein
MALSASREKEKQALHSSPPPPKPAECRQQALFSENQAEKKNTAACMQLVEGVKERGARFSFSLAAEKVGKILLNDTLSTPIITQSWRLV